MSESHLDLSLRQVSVAGGAAGNITVTGIRVGDVLKSVLHLNPNGGGAGITSLATLTSEFTITATNTINNTGGTATTGFVIVTWIAKHPSGDSLTRN